MADLRDCQMNNTFPFKLHRLICDAIQRGQEDIVYWSPDGMSFRVADRERFAKELMPFYFGSSKYRSFQKNLNMWGFDAVHRRCQTRGEGACFHKYFIRDAPHLCHRIVRQRVMVPSKVNKIATSEEEPSAALKQESPRDESHLSSEIVVGDPEIPKNNVSNPAEQRISTMIQQDKHLESIPPIEPNVPTPSAKLGLGALEIERINLLASNACRVRAMTASLRQQTVQNELLLRLLTQTRQAEESPETTRLSSLFASPLAIAPATSSVLAGLCPEPTMADSQGVNGNEPISVLRYARAIVEEEQIQRYLASSRMRHLSS